LGVARRQGPFGVDAGKVKVGAIRFPPENVRGNIEYKKKLSAEVGSERFNELVTQLNWRMRECADDSIEACVDIDVDDLGHHREAIYHIGVADDGKVVGLDEKELALSIQTLDAMASEISAEATVVSRRDGLPPGNRSIVTALVRPSHRDGVRESGFEAIRVCTVGNVDSGKSTLMGVLSRGTRDDGRDRARSAVFNHQHEADTGRTSSIASLLLGFDVCGRVVNYVEDDGRAFRTEEPQHKAMLDGGDAAVVQRAAKLITFSDLCGHERYFKTTLSGLIGLNPDYLLCTLDANRGEMRGMIHEHLMVGNILSIPTIVCLTKVDMATADAVSSTLADLKRTMKSMDAPLFRIKDQHDVVMAAERVLQGYVPVVPCSAVTGHMIPELKLLLNLLKKRSRPSGEAGTDVHVVVEDVFPQVPGVGLVVSGRIVRGTIKVGDALMLGPLVSTRGVPLSKSGFLEAKISSMRFEDAPAAELGAGSVGTFALKLQGKGKATLAENPGVISRGRVLLSKQSPLMATTHLKANISILQHPSSIKVGYEPVLHVGMVRRSARLIGISGGGSGEGMTTLRAGDSAEVLFRWNGQPEVIEVGSPVVFREALVKGVGTVTWVGELEPQAAARARKGQGKDSSRARVANRGRRAAGKAEEEGRPKKKKRRGGRRNR
jgi:GTPase